MFGYLLIFVGAVGAWFLLKMVSSGGTTSIGSAGNSSDKVGVSQESKTAPQQQNHQDRYAMALELWEASNAEDRGRAVKILQELVAAGADFPEPYSMAAKIFAQVDQVANSKEIVTLLRKASELAPTDAEIAKQLEIALFTHGKVSWDRGNEVESFNTYLEGLRRWSAEGNVLNQDSPIYVRIGFLAARLFSNNALKADNTELGVRLLDYCEEYGIDMNMDLDVSDATRN